MLGFALETLRTHHLKVFQLDKQEIILVQSKFYPINNNNISEQLIVCVTR